MNKILFIVSACGLICLYTCTKDVTLKNKQNANSSNLPMAVEKYSVHQDSLINSSTHATKTTTMDSSVIAKNTLKVINTYYFDGQGLKELNLSLW